MHSGSSGFQWKCGKKGTLPSAENGRSGVPAYRVDTLCKAARIIAPVLALLMAMPLLFILAAMLLVAAPASAQSTTDDFVLVQKGELPIILTAPHGGRLALPGIAVRNIEGKPSPQFNVGGDTNTDVLVQEIAREIKRLTGKDAYLVMARYQRRFIDANRAPRIAFDDTRAAQHYDRYHQSIRQFVDEVRSKYPAGLLIDVHGQHKFPDHLVRGTLNGRSVVALIKRAGVEAVVGPKGLYGQLEANGFAIFPANDVPPQGKHEDAGFNGGFTVAQYGSHKPNGIDAVQFEFGVKHRQKGEVEATAKRAAQAIVAFYEVYLKAQ